MDQILIQGFYLPMQGGVLYPVNLITTSSLGKSGNFSLRVIITLMIGETFNKLAGLFSQAFVQ